jgi:Lon protease-like protein
VISSFRETNGLNVGSIEVLPDEPVVQIPDEYQSMPSILAGVLDDLGRLYESLERRMDDASWVASRFVEILPIDLEQKQQYLESSDPVDRLRIVQELLDAARLPATGG